jgi:hypothetical protein
MAPWRSSRGRPDTRGAGERHCRRASSAALTSSDSTCPPASWPRTSRSSPGSSTSCYPRPRSAGRCPETGHGHALREDRQDAGCRCGSFAVVAQGRTMRWGGQQADKEAGASGSARGLEQQQQQEESIVRSACLETKYDGEQMLNDIAEGSERTIDFFSGVGEPYMDVYTKQGKEWES